MDKAAEQTWTYILQWSSRLPSNSHLCIGHKTISDGCILQGTLMLSKYAMPDSQIEEAPGDVQYLAVGAAGALLRCVAAVIGCPALYQTLLATTVTSRLASLAASTPVGRAARGVCLISTGVSAGTLVEAPAGVLARVSAGVLAGVLAQVHTDRILSSCEEPGQWNC